MERETETKRERDSIPVFSSMNSNNSIIGFTIKKAFSSSSVASFTFSKEEEDKYQM